MNKYRDQIFKLEAIGKMCHSLSSIAKYKYVKYLNKINFLKGLLHNIEKYRDNSYNYIETNKKGCLIVINSINYYVIYKKNLEKYDYVFIICDSNTEKKINIADNNQKCDKKSIFSFNNKKIKEFKTNNYEGEILERAFCIMRKTHIKALDVYYNNKFINKYTNVNKYSYDNNNLQIHIYEILFCIYLNNLILYMCLNESQNLDEAIKKINIQIKQTKTQYKNYKSKQHLFNICKFHS